MKPIKTAMVMAAGLGTRLSPFTEVCPKAFVPLMGIPIIQYALDGLTYSGVERVVVNIHHLADQAAAKTKSLDGSGAQIFTSVERELLGSAGGIQNALPLLGNEPFFLVNADVFSNVNWSALSFRHQILRKMWGVTLTLALIPVGPKGGAYREILFDPATGLIQGLGEVVPNKPFFIGAAVIEKEALAKVPPFGASEFVPKILMPAIENKKAGFYMAQSLWHDLGTPELWLESHLHLLNWMETRTFTENYAVLWKKRIESTNRRVAEKVWVGSQTKRWRGKQEWKGPCYWNPLDEKSDPPSSFGPRAVLYGSGHYPGGPGIGYGKKWVQILDTSF